MNRPEDDGVPLSDRPLEILISATTTNLAVDEQAIISIVLRILTDAGIDRGEISLALVDDDTIHRLNRVYLDHDYPTDVISFPLDGGEGWLHGEVIASVDTAMRCAAELEWPPASELALYVIHGVLHLVGHNDKQDSERAAMRQAEMTYLACAGIDVPPNARLESRVARKAGRE